MHPKKISDSHDSLHSIDEITGQPQAADDVDGLAHLVSAAMTASGVGGRGKHPHPVLTLLCAVLLCAITFAVRTFGSDLLRTSKPDPKASPRAASTAQAKSPAARPGRDVTTGPDYETDKSGSDSEQVTMIGGSGNVGKNLGTVKNDFSQGVK